MSSVIQSSGRRKFPMFTVMGACLCLYFSFHLLFGEMGYLKLVSLSHQYEVSSMEYEAVKAEREALEKRVVAMRSGSIDPDLFEERVQVMLGVLPENAVVIKNSF